ncbi:hypothetical protein [Marinomonas ostreistagni]|uniref:hypothetical protein n=1 Tax=Marinomonas ostreistagni TaxID=359209 RepID=UPI00194FB58C|nr:hypothetical protein [Marinomonas ostreistagni]MBM6550797.1 hypothetical protein [Marinomonas ostreistagni]
MTKYTVLQRDHLTRAESEADKIEQLTSCGYRVCKEVEADSAEAALAQYQAEPTPAAPESPAIPQKYRKFLWLGLVCAVLWFLFVIFGLLPLAFPD